MAVFETSDGCSIRYEASGRKDGRSVVLVHGLCSNHGIFRLAAPALAPRFNVVAMDCRGHGESQAKAPFTLDRLGRDASELGGNGAVGIGHGMGAQAILKHTTRAPGAFSALVLIGAGRRALGADSGWASTRRRAVLAVSASGSMDSAWEAYLEGGLFGVSPDELPDELISSWKGDFTRTNAQAFIDLADDLDHVALHDFELEAVTVPTLVVAGSADAPYRELAEELARSLPNGVFAEIPDAGHTPHLDSAEEFNEVVFDFLRKAV